VTARDVIAQALALSEAATPGTTLLPPEEDMAAALTWLAETKGYRSGWFAEEASAICADVLLAAAARTLLPALAKALGGVLAVVESSEMSDGPYRNVLHTTAIRRAITAALSEVTP